MKKVMGQTKAGEMLCTKCERKFQVDDFKDFDIDSGTGTCFYCHPPEFDERRYLRVMAIGDQEQVNSENEKKERFLKYTKTGRKIEHRQRKTKLVWNDKARIVNSVQIPDRKSKPEELTYEDAREIMWRCYESIVLYETERKPVIDVQQKEVFENYVKWLIRDESSKYSLRKSIIFWGGLGVGKSTIVAAGRVMMNYIKKALDWEDMTHGIVYMDRLIFDLRVNQSLEPLSKLSQGFWCIDEIAPEHNDYNHFGNKMKLINDVLRARHLAWKGHRTLTILTTNIPPKALGSVLKDDRLLDRMMQEYTTVEIPGINKRTTHFGK